MDMDFNLDNITQFHLMRNGGQIKPCEPGPNGFDPANIFIKRRRSNEESPIGFSKDLPNIQEFDPIDSKELEDYCKLRGIIGVNFGGMHPRQVLNMLKAKTGIPTESTKSKKTILHG